MISHPNRYTKQTLEQHVWKLNKIFFRTKSFKQQCVLLYAFLNQVEITAHCSFIGLNYSDFNSQCLSNVKHSFSEMLSPKNHSQVSFDKKGYQDTVLVSFTATTPAITTNIHNGKHISFPSSMNRKDFDKNCVRNFLLLTGDFVMLE